MFTSIVLLLLLSAAAHAATCNDFWTHPGGGDWVTAGNWSAGVPTTASDVCLDDSHGASGSYTVDIDTYNPALVANSITVGGTAGSTVTLAILGTGGGVQVGDVLTLSNQSAGGGVLSTGAITLGMAEGGGIGQPGAINVTSGTLVNQGTITSESTSEPGQNNTINGSFDNAGTLNVDQGFAGNLDLGSWTTSGTINVAARQTLALSGSSASSAFDQAAGVIADNGTFSQQGGSFIANGSGTVSGNPLTLGGTVTLSPSGTGSGSFHLQTGGATLGSNIGRGYTVWSSGIPGLTHGNLTAPVSLTNSGTIELGSIDGTHGTLDVTGGTLTNDGALVFENTANGPDGLSGALVNHGVVSGLNSVQGSGQITNAGTFALTPGVTFGATSYAQTSGGTLSLALTGGGPPLIPELQLTGAAQLAGGLAVATTGTATGTFPIIASATRSGTFSAPHFSGESFTTGYTGTGVNLTGPAAPSTSKPTVHVGAITGGRGKIRVKLSCSRGSGSCPKARLAATITEHLKGKRITAVTARSKKTVTLVRASKTLKAGSSGTVTLTLTGSAKALLARFGKLKTIVTVSITGKTAKTVTVTVTKPKKAKKKTGA